MKWRAAVTYVKVVVDSFLISQVLVKLYTCYTHACVLTLAYLYVELLGCGFVPTAYTKQSAINSISYNMLATLIAPQQHIMRIHKPTYAIHSLND